MKKIVLLFAFSFIWCFNSLAQDDCKDIPQPISGKLIHDFYNAISETTESNLENLLIKYNDSTSIEFAVVTLKDLGYEYESRYATKIGNCWGVGKSKYDNGIVILVSFEGDRKWAIATGKGIEQYLTDYTASSIGQSFLIPSLQKGEIDKAFENTIQAIIEHLGWRSWELREYWHNWNQETSKLEKDYRRKENAGVGASFISVIFSIALLLFISWCIIKIIEESKIRRKIKSSIKKWDKEIFWTNPIFLKDNNPKWFLKELNLLKQKDKSSRKGYEENKSTVLRAMKDSPKKALEDLLPKLSEYYNWVVFKIPEAIKKLEDKKEFYEREAIVRIGETKELAETSIKTIKKFMENGFLFSDYLSKLASQKDILESLESKLTQKDQDLDSFKLCHEEAVLSEESINSIINEAQLNFKCHNEISSEYNSLSKKIEILSNEEKNNHEKILDSLKKVHPENVWQELNSNFSNVDKILSDADSKIKQAAKENEILEPSSLEKAYTSYREGITLVGSVKLIYESIVEAQGRQNKAKAEYSRINNSAKRALEEAVEKCTQSHVKSEAKELRDKAAENMKKAEEMLSSGIVDWVWLVALLLSVKETAEKSYSRASSDISYYRSSHSSSSYSGSSSRSSFGGYGGGSFGGGGAGGRW